MIYVHMNNVGTVEADEIAHTLTPRGVPEGIRLFMLIHKDPIKAFSCMAEIEATLLDYFVEENVNPWFWRLRTPPTYKPCNCCVV